jgi:hypothetical protein
MNLKVSILLLLGLSLTIITAVKSETDEFEDDGVVVEDDETVNIFSQFMFTSHDSLFFFLVCID